MTQNLKRGAHAYEVIDGEVLESAHHQETSFTAKSKSYSRGLEVTSSTTTRRENWVRTSDGRQVLIHSHGDVPLRAGMKMRALCLKGNGVYFAARTLVLDMNLVSDAKGEFELVFGVIGKFLVLGGNSLLWLFVGFPALLSAIFSSDRRGFAMVVIAVLAIVTWLTSIRPFNRYWAWVEQTLPA